MDVACAVESFILAVMSIHVYYWFLLLLMFSFPLLPLRCAIPVYYDCVIYIPTLCLVQYSNHC